MKRESKSEESSDFFWAYINVSMSSSLDGQFCRNCQILCTIEEYYLIFLSTCIPNHSQKVRKIVCIIYTKSMRNFKFLYVLLIWHCCNPTNIYPQNSVFHSLAISLLTLKPFSRDLPSFHPNNFFLDYWIFGFLAIGITWRFASGHSVCWYKT